MHESLRENTRRRLLLLVLAAGLAWAGGCDDDDFDRKPPPGQGTLVVDNNTFNDISVFIDSVFQERIAREDKRTPYDLDPALYRLVLEERGGKANFRGDVDILTGRRLFVQVFEPSFDRTRYDVRIFYD